MDNYAGSRERLLERAPPPGASETEELDVSVASARRNRRRLRFNQWAAFQEWSKVGRHQLGTSNPHRPINGYKKSHQCPLQKHKSTYLQFLMAAFALAYMLIGAAAFMWLERTGQFGEGT